jgi:serine protease Do
VNIFSDQNDTSVTVEEASGYTVTDYTSDLTAMADAVKGSVVRINGKEKASGFIYAVNDQTIEIVTVSSAAVADSEVTVTFASGAQETGTVIGTDEGTGAAVVEVNADFTATAFTRGNSDQIDEGEYGAVLGGHDRSVSEGSITFGVMSGVFTDVLNASLPYHVQLIGFDGNVPSESNGGPLCDVSGALIGMINLNYTGNGSHSYAVGINDIHAACDEIINEGEVTRGILDLSLTNVSSLTSYQKNERGMMLDQTDGVIVNSVGESLKDQIQEDDVITKINDTEISSMSDVRSFLYNCVSGDALTLTIVRGDTTTEVTVNVQ